MTSKIFQNLTKGQRALAWQLGLFFVFFHICEGDTSFVFKKKHLFLVLNMLHIYEKYSLRKQRK